MHVGQKNRLLQQTVIQIRKNSGEGSKILKPLPQNPYAKNWEFFCFANALPVLKKKQRAGARRNFLASCPALFNFTYIYDDYPVKISRRFSLRLTPNCFMLPGRKEKRLLHFSFHAAGAAKGSSFSFTPRSRCCRSRDACRPSPLYVYIISVWGSLQLPSSRLAFGRKNDQTPD